MKNREYNNWRKVFQTIFLVGSVLFITQASTHGAGISNINIIGECHVLIDQSSFLLVVNPTANNQLEMDQKVSKKAKRKALRKYVKKLKKDTRKFNEDKLPKESKITLSGIMIWLGVFLLCVVLLVWVIGSLGGISWYGG